MQKRTAECENLQAVPLPEKGQQKAGTHQVGTGFCCGDGFPPLSVPAGKCADPAGSLRKTKGIFPEGPCWNYLPFCARKRVYSR